MTEANTEQGQEAEAPAVIVEYEAECDSLTGRSSLTFQVGRDPKTNEPMLRIARNSGGGMFCKDWALVSTVDAELAKADPLTARSLQYVHPGKSINTPGFLLAIMKSLQVVKVKEDNTRHHELIAGATLQTKLTERIAKVGAADTFKTRRKAAKAE